MTQINFYKETPSVEQIATDLGDNEIVIFDHMRSGAKMLIAQVRAQTETDCVTHHENTIRPWNGEDYFVIIRSSFRYLPIREDLRAIALQWVLSGRPNQYKKL